MRSAARSSTQPDRSSSLFLMTPRPPRSTLFPYTTLFRSQHHARYVPHAAQHHHGDHCDRFHDGEGLDRSEEHTSELQSRENLVCRLLLEKKKTTRSSTRRARYCTSTPRNIRRRKPHKQYS